MNTLGYINLFWLSELMRRSLDNFINCIKAGSEGLNYKEADIFIVFPYRGNSRGLNLFIKLGLSAIFIDLNKFQKSLILDSLALAVAKDTEEVWDLVNYLVVFHEGGRMKLSALPLEMFSQFFDCLASKHIISLTEYIDFENYKYDETDSIDLYKYC